MNLIRWIGSPLHRVAALLLLALAVASVYLLHPEWFSRERLLGLGRGMPAGWLLAAFFVLPATGFPISIFLLVAGMRFGFLGGMGWTAAAVIFHHVLVYCLAHGWMRPKVERWLTKSEYKIPVIEQHRRIGWTVFFAAAQGPPYALKLYLLALTDMPFRIYAGAGAPVYVLFCAVPVGIGSSVWSVNPLWVYVAMGVIALSFWSICKVRRQIAKKAGS
jgi:uncharacterized membrane protein YdjX (TVP38/TMEM64 family)